MAEEFKGKAIFLKVNGNKCPDCIDEQGVTAFPSFHLYRCSSLLDEIVGVKEADLKNAIGLHI